MTRQTRITLAVAATVLAGVLVYFWALRPLGFASYLSSTRSSDADVIRQYWPYRLVHPEWVSEVPDRLMNWHLAEAATRLALTGGLWLAFIVIVGRGVTFTPVWRRRGKPNPQPGADPNRPFRSSGFLRLWRLVRAAHADRYDNGALSECLFARRFGPRWRCLPSARCPLCVETECLVAFSLLLANSSYRESGAVLVFYRIAGATRGSGGGRRGLQRRETETVMPNPLALANNRRLVCLNGLREIRCALVSSEVGSLAALAERGR
jgi:hypothetical protein